MCGLSPSFNELYRSERVSDILKAIDAGNLAVLALLDLLAAFDTFDHATLLQRPKTTCGVDGTVLKWISSYLNYRSQFDAVRPSLHEDASRMGSCKGRC
jgi:hypothetical protein